MDQLDTACKFRVLILGDGNFSFSLALARHLWHPQHPSIPSHLVHQSIAKRYLGLPPTFSESNIHILATSFDTRPQLLAKYGDFKDILSALEDVRYRGLVDILHGVNAWDLGNHFGSSVVGGFDLILWNHPHLGTEDFRLHRFLMAHFFDSVAQVLRHPKQGLPTDKYNGGHTRVSLVQGQEVRWDLVRQAQRSQLALESIAWFDESHWPGYIVKRNKHGGSFKNEHTRRHVQTEMKSCYFTFKFGDDGIDPEVFPAAHQQVLAMHGQATVSDSGHSFCLNQSNTAEQQNNDVNVLEAAICNLDLNHSIDNKTALVDNSTTSTVASVLTRTTTKTNCSVQPVKGSKKQLRQANVPSNLVCTYCCKQLTSLRAYTQHVHMVHELQLFGQDWKPIRVRSFTCDKCPKTFATKNDLWQHGINKHTKINPLDLPSAPDNSHLGLSSVNGADAATDSDYDYVPCDVCGQAVVRRDWGMLLHLESLKPAVGLDMCCPLCPKTFIEQRALYQHYKFCSSKKYVDDDINKAN
ncbi:hypothetical protein O5D80_005666 [Batrachochytrium dendrobatidis]|nr:hypothetical protein O5D80_005666 [Batrachochytrium dendrobatidis]